MDSLAFTVASAFGALELDLAWAADWRVPALIGLGFAFASAMIVALHQFRFFSQMRNPENFVNQELKRARLHLGAPPKKDSTIAKRKRKIRRVKQAAWRALWARFWLLFTAGHLIPSALLFIVVLNYSAFRPGSFPFEEITSGLALAKADPTSSGVFVLGQFFRGAFLDVAEIFRMETGPITNNTSDWLFSSILVFFRALTGLYTGALLLFLAQSLLVRLRVARLLRLKSDEELGV
ncbi:conserved protein [Tepidicaulis marinus]|jgi:hypothetical protein|uniref:Conserved protein n=1 Tax=Tepidicaulis marinus TaxID=1333998 RepID=A0A081B764_9HYPH|nr:hypothetical protein [Tepidicaulis marinus]GAK43882.1 conserved protein [Tepidicaulis marinus]